MKPTQMPVVQRLHGGKPVITAVPTHPWENKVTFNPACAYVGKGEELERIIAALPFDRPTRHALEAEAGLCFVIYRAQGGKTDEQDHTRSTMGLAVLSPDLRLLARHSTPVLVPEFDYENLGVEDGRLAKVGDRYVLSYTGYRSGKPNNAVRLALASTRDFVHWEKHGLVNADFNSLDNKNSMLFEGKIGGKFVMLHRPMEGTDAMCVHWAEADDVFGVWTDRGVLMRPIRNPAFADTWIGGGAPPLKLSHGRYLLIYHIGNCKADKTKEYDLGIAILDPALPDPVVKRDEPLIRPTTVPETVGDAELGVNNVVFICGAYFHDGFLWLPYAGADSLVLAGRIPLAEIEPYAAT
jgi:predicted GH43/DUF377 family glycosyl hydrolase